MGLMSSPDDIAKNVELYFGIHPDDLDDDIFPSFTNENFIPIGWFFFFSPNDVITRGDANPTSWQDLIADSTDAVTEIGIENIDEYMKEPIMLQTTLPEAKARLMAFKNAFQNIDYIWSYFRVLEIMDAQLEKLISELEENPVIQPIKKIIPDPDQPRSQVKSKEKTPKKEKKKKAPKAENDNPFAALEDFGSGDTSTQEVAIDSDDPFAGLGDDLLSALEAATELDKLHDVIDADAEAKIEREERDPSVLPIFIKFDSLATNGAGYKIGKIPVLLERLLHHANREGEMTRIMQDYLQDIFRELSIDWRITGLLAEDFVGGNPELLSEIMIGTPSPFIIIHENFDVKYWTTAALQVGDERLMFTLTMLPSEEIHRAMVDGKLADISDRVGQLLVTTRSYKFPQLNMELLKESPSKSNIWGFRVLVQDGNRQFRAATILCENPSTSWEEDFKSKINLPGVLRDWNIEYLARFGDYSDSDKYRIVLKRAKDIEDSFHAFVRWGRRHHILYQQRYGVRGTILALKDQLEKTEDKELGKLIFDILTSVTEFGITEATEVLSDEVIVRKLPWLYS